MAKAKTSAPLIRLTEGQITVIGDPGSVICAACGSESVNNAPQGSPGYALAVGLIVQLRGCGFGLCASCVEDLSEAIYLMGDRMYGGDGSIPPDAARPTHSMALVQ